MIKLHNAVLCAMADFAGMYDEGLLTLAAKRTFTELYEAMGEVGSHIGDYQEYYNSMKSDLNDAEQPAA